VVILSFDDTLLLSQFSGKIVRGNGMGIVGKGTKVHDNHGKRGVGG
jgi:hypothetical protein